MDPYLENLSAKISASKMSLLMFEKALKTMKWWGKILKEAKSENSKIELFHFSVIRAQRIHEAKLASIAVRKNRNTQAAAISNTVDNHERFFRNKQRIHNYK